MSTGRLQMKLIRDLNNHRLFITEEDKIILELGYVADEFAIIFHEDVEIPITKKLDKTLYESLNSVLDTNYYFSNNCGKQDKDSIVWLSDGTCDLDDEESRNKVNHLTIRRYNNTIYLSVTNPFCDTNGYKKRYKLIAFSPAGNGFFAVDRDTGSFFQDDIIRCYRQTLNAKVARL